MNDAGRGAEAPPIRSRVVRGVGMLSLNRPPANLLGPTVRRLLWDRIAGYESNPSVGAIVLIAEGRVFSAGVDPAEHDRPVAEPSLAEVCQRIEACTKPVIAVLQGPALGGGAELAMAAHWRLAVPGATIGLPDIALGLVPGAGGAQRLARLIGPDPALRLLLSGKSVTAETGQTLGLIDGLIEGEPGSAGHAFALSLIDRGALPRPTGAIRGKLADGAGALQAVARTRAALPEGLPAAAGRIVDCVEAALLLPFPAALEFEAAAHDDSLADPESRALRHVAIAERRISSGLLAPDGKGGRTPTEAGRRVVAALLAAQDRAIGWLVSRGLTEDAVDAAFLDWGFAIAPFGGRVRDGAAPEVRPRVTAAMAAAGARLIETGAVARASDIDALAVHGMGFPRKAGGPMKAVELAGLFQTVRRMRDWAQDDPLWTVPDTMLKASRVAGGFAAVALPTLRLE